MNLGTIAWMTALVVASASANALAQTPPPAAPAADSSPPPLPPPTPPPAPAATQPPAPPPPENESETSPARTAFNALYVEGLGPAIFYSMNYERVFGDFSARAGLGLVASGGETWVGVPLTVSYLGIGNGKHMFEIGAGVAIQHFDGDGALLANGSSTTLLGTVILGYRLQPPKGGFMLRAGLSPIFGSGGFLPWPHFAIGAAF